MTESKAQSKKKTQTTQAKKPVVAEAKPETVIEEPVQEVIEAVEAVTETVEEAEPMFSSSLESAEKMMSNFIEFNESAYKSSGLVTQTMYENYVSNVNAMFTDLKALSETTTPTEFYRVAIDNNSAAYDRMQEQFQSVSDLTEQVMQETMNAGKKACVGVFPTAA